MAPASIGDADRLGAAGQAAVQTLQVDRRALHPVRLHPPQVGVGQHVGDSVGVRLSQPCAQEAVADHPPQLGVAQQHVGGVAHEATAWVPPMPDSCERLDALARARRGSPDHSTSEGMGSVADHSGKVWRCMRLRSHAAVVS